MARPVNRIGVVSIIAMVAIALPLDILSLIPFVNILTDLVAVAIFGLWFYLLDVGFINPKLFGSALIGFVIELVPILSWLPGLTAAVIASIIIVKLEDAKVVSALSPAHRLASGGSRSNRRP